MFSCKLTTTMQPTMLCCVMFLFLLAAVVDETDIQEWTFKINRQKSKFILTVLQENSRISRIQCIVECSQSRGCFTIEYKQSGSICTKYRLFRKEDGKAALTGSGPGVHSFTMNDPRGQHPGEMCSSHVDCVDDRTQCIDNVCKCMTGYRLKHGDPACTTDRKKKHYGEKCSLSSDCVDDNTQCILAKCKCVIGYSFNPKDRSCIKECDKYDKAFSLLTYQYCSHGFKGTEHRFHDLPNFKRCSEKCMHSKSFKCRSFELWNGGCYLFNDTRLGVPDKDWREYEGCKHYQRNCAWLKRRHLR